MMPLKGVAFELIDVGPQLVQILRRLPDKFDAGECDPVQKSALRSRGGADY